MHETIEITAHNTFPVYHVTPEGTAKHPGLIIIHEVWGLTDHIKDVARRFAKEGYEVLAPDLLSHTGITEKVDQSILAAMRDPKTKADTQKKLRAAMTPLQVPGFAEDTVAKLKACVGYLLASKNGTGKIGVVGYCFGGTYAYALAVSDNRLSAVIPYYGHAPEDLEKLQNISCPILAFYGEQDTGLMEGLPDLEEAMQKYHKDFTAVVYPDTGHAFFNDTNTVTYHQENARDAWKKTLAFLAKNL